VPDGVRATIHAEKRPGGALTPPAVDRKEPPIMSKDTCDLGVEALRRVGNTCTVRCKPCGKTFKLFACRITRTRSCGCAQRRAISAAMTTHGESTGGPGAETPEHRAWIHMWARCRHPVGRNRWHKGVTVCDRWKKYENFLADMGRKPSSKHSLDRKKSSAGYTPNNCRWATAKEQARNWKTRQRVLSFRGKSMCVAAWAEETGISASVIGTRLFRGWSTERTLTTQIKQRDVA
jgi:hypothetical protein